MYREERDTYQKGPGVSKVGESMPSIAEKKVAFRKPLPHKSGVGKAYELGTVKVARAIKNK